MVHSFCFSLSPLACGTQIGGIEMRFCVVPNGSLVLPPRRHLVPYHQSHRNPRAGRTIIRWQVTPLRATHFFCGTQKIFAAFKIVRCNRSSTAVLSFCYGFNVINTLSIVVKSASRTRPHKCSPCTSFLKTGPYTVLIDSMTVGVMLHGNVVCSNRTLNKSFCYKLLWDTNFLTLVQPYQHSSMCGSC